MITEGIIEEIRDNSPCGKEIEFYVNSRFMYSIPLDAWQYGINSKNECKRIAILHITGQLEREHFDAHKKAVQYTIYNYCSKTPKYIIYIKLDGVVMEQMPLYLNSGDRIPF